MGSYGDLIKHHRKASGFKTQKDFAKATGISAATISRIEDNKHRPAPETIQAFAKLLPTTSRVELMVACGYWDSEYVRNNKHDENAKVAEDPPSYLNEREFIEKIDLTDEELLKQFKLVVDGRDLTPDEARNVIAFVRVHRQMNQGD